MVLRRRPQQMSTVNDPQGNPVTNDVYRYIPIKWLKNHIALDCKQSLEKERKLCISERITLKQSSMATHKATIEHFLLYFSMFFLLKISKVFDFIYRFHFSFRSCNEIEYSKHRNQFFEHVRSRLHTRSNSYVCICCTKREKKRINDLLVAISEIFAFSRLLLDFSAAKLNAKCKY